MAILRSMTDQEYGEFYSQSIIGYAEDMVIRNKVRKNYIREGYGCIWDNIRIYGE